MERKIKAVALYVRKSRDDNDSLEGQLLSLIEYCERFNWEYQVFKEEGSASSEDWNRPELQRMIKLIEKQHFDAALVTEQSRITRADEFPKFRNVLQEANCLFITTQTNQIYDYNKPEDEFVSDIMSAVAKQEIAFTKLRLKRGTIQSAKKGNWLGKKSPVGYSYNKDTKRLEPNEDAEIIRRLFEEYRNGLSTIDIANKFTAESVTTSTGMIWTSAGISRLLNNIAYIGHSLYGRTTQKKDKVTGKRITKRTNKDEQILVKNTHDPIISQELWDEVQKIRLKRNSKPVPMKFAKHKFSGLIKCGLCGAVHSFQRSRGKKKRITSCQTRLYKDNSMNEYEMCPNRGANIEEFEILFFTYLKGYIDKLKEYTKKIKESEPRHKDDRTNDVKNIEFKIKKYQQDIKRVQQGFMMQIFTEREAQEQIKKIKQQVGLLESQIEEIKKEDDNSDTDHIKKTLEKLENFYNGRDVMPEREFNEILHELVEFIIYTKTESEMELKIIPKLIIN